MGRRRSDDMFTQLWELFMLTPWWVCPIVAAVFYVIIAVVIPQILATHPLLKLFIPACRTFAPFMSIGILIIGLFTCLKKLIGRVMLDRQVGLNTINDLTWREFEQLIAAAYRMQGYKVLDTNNGADGGIDLILYRNGEKAIVQCKHWRSNKVGVTLIRELNGLTHSREHAGSRGVFVTFGAYTSDAIDFARENGIELVGNKKLWQMIKASQRAKSEQKTPSPAEEPSTLCPICGSPMVIRTARRGTRSGSKFWGCSRYPACKGTQEC